MSSAYQGAGGGVMSHEPKVSLIFAMAQNRAIGAGGDIPWHISDDLKRFKALTMGHVCIMGRKTFESIVARLGKPLPGRTTLVVSASGYAYGDIAVFTTVEAAIRAGQTMAQTQNQDEIFICGGAAVYAAALPVADRLYVTRVESSPEADTFMPPWDEDLFCITEAQHINANPAYSFIDYERISSPTEPP